MAQVSLKKIVKHYDDKNPVIHGVDLDIRDGEFIVFVGPSGCGKSTLLRMIAGLEEITGGELYIGENLANDVHPAKRGLAMVFQSYALYPHMTVYENMAFALQLAGQKRSVVEASVQRAADILQIGPLLKRKPKELSGGQRQRVAIGRAIVRKPELFLFDEPLSNLDASLRVQMRVELSRLHRELRTTMIYVTHDQVEAMTLGERIVIFNAGRIEQVGSPLELYEHPGNLFVAGFLGSPRMNFITGHIASVSVSESGVAVALPNNAIVNAAVVPGAARTGDQVTLGLRAEHMAFCTANDQSNCVDVGVGHVEHLGDVSIVYADFPGAVEMAAIKHVAETTPPHPGSAARVHLPPQRCHLFDAAGTAFKRIQT